MRGVYGDEVLDNRSTNNCDGTGDRGDTGYAAHLGHDGGTADRGTLNGGVTGNDLGRTLPVSRRLLA